MWIYYLLIFLIICISILTSMIKSQNAKKIITLVPSTIGIILLQGLRHPTIGTDTQSYITGYRLSRNLNFLEGDTLFNFEIGFSILMNVLARAGISEQQFLFIVSVLIIAPIAVLIGKKSKSYMLSLILYISLGFFLFSFSGIRQAIAFSITFFSFRFVENRKLLKFIMSIFLASLFHSTAVVFIFAYPLYRIRIKRTYIIHVCLSLLLVFLLREPLYIAIHSLLRTSEPRIVNTGAYTMLFIMFATYLASYFLCSKKNTITITDSYNAYQNYLLMAVFIQIFASVSNVAMRAGFYYYIFIILLVPELIKQLDNRYLKVLFTMVTVLVSIAFFRYQAGSGYLNIVPYKFFWN